MKRFTALSVAALLLWSGTSAQAADEAELLELRNTTRNLIEALVREGVLSRERADQLMREAEASARDEMQARERAEAVPEAGKDVIRVPYVPEFVKEEIRDQVRSELREDVVGDVMAQAKNERWGVPDALPEWISRFKFKGDIRLRSDNQLFDDNNGDTHVDFNELNASGSDQDALLNTTQDRYRTRVRMRLGVDAQVTHNLKAGLRITSGNRRDPVSTNQTLGNTGSRYELALDHAFLKYDRNNADGKRWLTLWGGRFPNPWFAPTDLVWDSDLGFEGVAAHLTRSLSGSDSLYDIDESQRQVFLTLGAFPLQEVKLSNDDKWLFGAQAGAAFQFDDQSTFDLGVGYFSYYNIRGKRNALNSNLRDFTAPEFLQSGNTLFQIDNDGDAFVERVGLAANYDLLNVGLRYDLARFAPMHMVLSAEYVRNLGYDAGDVRARTGGVVFANGQLAAGDHPFSAKTDGWYANFTYGWPSVLLRGRWQASLGYKYLERDAVLDAFADSDFHLGGTNAKGWILGVQYGVMDNAWLNLRWMSADEIDGDPYRVDLLQLDLNARF